MNDTQHEGRRLYKVRGRDGEAEWVDHDELWRLQQSQAEALRRDHARRRRQLLLALAGLVVLALALVALRLRSGRDTPPSVAVEAPQRPAAGTTPEAVAGPAAAVAGAAAMTGPPIATGDRATRLGPAASDGGPSPAEQVAGAVRVWAGAWARRDVPAYLASYAGEFEPAGGLARPDWESLRRRRLLAPTSIRVEIEELEIALPGEGRAEARFLQRYSSPRYSDVVRKRLDLVAVDGEWRIVTERSQSP